MLPVSSTYQSQENLTLYKIKLSLYSFPSRPSISNDSFIIAFYAYHLCLAAFSLILIVDLLLEVEIRYFLTLQKEITKLKSSV